MAQFDDVACGPTAQDRSAAPIVSVVVPSYRMGATLRGALDSLLGQTHRPLEILVRDNGSDDGTREVLRAYADRLDHVCTQPDSGQSDALRKGFAQSRGEILGWLNADDLLMPNAIEQVVAAFQAPDRPDVVYGHCALLDREGQFQRYFHEIEPFSADRLRSVIDFVAQPSTFFRRTVYEEVGGVDSSLAYAMDWDLWCRMAARGARFRFLEDVLSGARHYADTKTASGGLARWREILRVNRIHRTTRIPVAAMAHLYGDMLGPRLPWLHRPIRRFARGWLGEVLRAGQPVLGIGPGGAIATPGFALRFPVHRAVVGGRIRLTGAGSASVRVEGRLEGRTIEARRLPYSTPPSCELSWRWPSPRWTGAFHLDVLIESAGGRPWAGRLLDVHLDLASEGGERLGGSVLPRNGTG